MKRMKRHKIKKEKSECSSHARDSEEHDLAHYIHDRVELMHQVFSMLKYKEIKAIAPECVRNLAIGDLQELCTEELLGISSKRLLAILDGAEPPSDTDSSSPSPPPDELETISLDSISSDEEMLNSSHNKKKKKHKHHNRHNSKKKDKAKEPDDQKTDDNAELSRASRAGLTVLELLELQARARAIRAQLQQEQIHKNLQETTTVDTSHNSSDNEVEIKEEPPDVVEISSEDEKPDINQLKSIADPSTNVISSPQVNQNKQENSHPVTKRINDLIITIPQTNTSRKIKLNRNKVGVSVYNKETLPPSHNEIPKSTTIIDKSVVAKKVDSSETIIEKSREGKTKKKKKDKRKKTVEKDGSDHDEITLQLSDSEKMDLFEDLDESRKNYDKVSSSSDDSTTSSSDSLDKNITDQPLLKNTSAEITANSSVVSERNIINNVSNSNADKIATKSCNEIEQTDAAEQVATTSKIMSYKIVDQNETSPIQQQVPNSYHNHSTIDKNNKEAVDPNESMATLDQNARVEILNPNQPTYQNEDSIITNLISEKNISDVNIPILDPKENSNSSTMVEFFSKNYINVPSKEMSSHNPTVDGKNGGENKTIEDMSMTTKDIVSMKDNDECLEDQLKNIKESIKNKKGLSEGELTDSYSSEVEAMDVRPEVVCISDEENSKNQTNKKKKKDKKSKKSKKSKSGCLDKPDQNFYRDSNNILEQELHKEDLATSLSHENKSKCDDIPDLINLDSDDVCEIFELSDDSSCSEIEGTLLSKEPTTEEIEALSAKIDEIKREEVVTDKQIQEHEQMLAAKEKNKQSDENIGNMSWRDRYLDSNKVKKVLTTANIFNALRKKNKELKKKIEYSKKIRLDEVVEKCCLKENDKEQLEEGTVEQYNTLEGSNKYIDPVKEVVAENIENDEMVGKKTKQAKEDENVAKEMKKDAKQLLKMYRRLLKYNDINKQTDPSKKKKKKYKKKDKREKQRNSASTT